MKTSTLFPMLALGATFILSGCNTSDSRVTSKQPGPAVGTAIGTVVGAVGSNVVGVAVGATEGAAAATKSTFTNERRVVRTWREETTADGRLVRVPVEVEVDEHGRPVGTVK